MAKMIGHASKPSGLVSKSTTNGSTCHPIFGGQDHGQICVVSPGFLCDDKCFI
jgi:hypothetical protein